MFGSELINIFCFRLAMYVVVLPVSFKVNKRSYRVTTVFCLYFSLFLTTFYHN